MKKLLLIALILFFWLQFEQFKGSDQHDSYLMQLEQRARVLQNGGTYQE